jgi:hypothetical protein
VATEYKYKQIFSTTNCFYEKLERIHRKRPIEEQWETYRDTYMDNAFAFFIFCYHIKDWIKNDPAIDKTVKSAVEDYINQNNCLMCCADIANGIKHFSLDKQRSVSRPRVTSEEMIMRADGSNKKPGSEEYADVTVETNAYVLTDDGQREISELASECLKAWDAFFKQNKIG